MLHFVFLCVFCGAVSIVLGAMLRTELKSALRLAAGIGGSMISIALVIAWLMYLLVG